MRRRPLRTHNLDQSWQRFRGCEWCGKFFCVNNNPERKSRVKRYQGKIICPWCIQSFAPAVRRYQKVTHSLEKVGCLKRLAKKGKPTGKFTEGCKCAACFAHTLTEQEKKATSAEPIADNIIKRNKKGI